MTAYTLELANETATLQFGRELGAALGPGDVVALTGPLGAGKTRLVQAAAAALGVEDEVTSPTFVIVHEYVGRMPLIHMDAYRLRDEAEFEAMGADEYFSSPNVTFIEWADRIAGSLPREYLKIFMEPTVAAGRRVTLVGHGARGIHLAAQVARRSSPGAL